MAMAIVLLVLVVGTVIFHFASPWWFTPLASNWGAIDDTITITFWVTGAVFVAVNVFMAYSIIKFRHKEGELAHYEPENAKLETWLTVITALGVAAMLAPGLYVWGEFVTVPEEADRVEAVGQQWKWMFRFPGKDGKLGEVDASFVSVDNQFGMNPDDRNGQDDILVDSNRVHLPIDRPVKVLLRSKDVLHDFAVAQFRVKMDLVPGLVTYLWFTPTKIGSYEILCEELCGLAHYTMRGWVVVDTQEDFDAWLDEQPTFAQLSAVAKGDPAAGAPLYPLCGACHGPEGEGMLALNAPKIAGQEDWYLIRQLRNYQNGARGAHENDIYGKQMAPMAATLVDQVAMNNVAAYIQSLPVTAPKTTISGGDVVRGERIFLTCGACHGKQGQGNYGTDSPRLVGQQDWYLVRQLYNFREGIRGAHHKDVFGPQMARMAAILKDDQSIIDVVSYINTLREDKQ